jgi:hypothetical protein
VKSAEDWALDTQMEMSPTELKAVERTVEAVRADFREALAQEYEKQARDGSSGLFRAADIARSFAVSS